MRKSDDFTSIGKLLKEGFFAIPEYQRDYAWSLSDCEILADDIIRATNSNSKHYLGSIVVMKLDETFKAQSAQGDPTRLEGASDNVYHVVDGQQRLTSCSLFLCALRDVIREDDASVFPAQRIKSQEKLISRISGFLEDPDTECGDDAAPRLFLNNDTSTQYQAILHGNGNQRSKGRKLKNAYARFKSIIVDRAPENPALHPDYYYDLIQAVTVKLAVDDVCCDSFGSAFQIFESINAKGQPLSPVDLIKCFLMQKAQANISDARARWNKLLETVKSNPDNSRNLERFMGAYLFTEMGRRVSKAQTYDTFKSLYESTSYSIIFDNLQYAAELYEELDSDSLDESDPYYAFHVLKLSQIYVPLLAAARFKDNGLHSSFFKELKSLLLPFAVRYQICGGSSNALDQKFSLMIDGIKNDESASDVFSPLRELMPSSDRFRTSFEELTFKDSEEGLARYLLCQIERYLERVDHQSEKNLPDNRTLEHIIPKEYSVYIKEWGDEELPDNFERDCIRSIGNLVLIGSKDNTSACNKPYSQKLSIYKQGHLSSAQHPTAGFNLLDKLVEEYPEEFKPGDVEKRAKRLSEYASATWMD